MYSSEIVRYYNIRAYNIVIINGIEIEQNIIVRSADEWEEVQRYINKYDNVEVLCMSALHNVVKTKIFEKSELVNEY